MNWGFGFIGGGDIKNHLNFNNAANQSISYLSIGDSKGVNNGGGNWSTVMSYNGIWPTAAGPGIHGNVSTNDFLPSPSATIRCGALKSWCITKTPAAATRFSDRISPASSWATT